MTDKQIKKNKNGFYCIEPCYEIKELKEKLLSKEQECEELNADNIFLRDRVGKLERAILRRNEQLDQLKAENEQLKEELSAIQHNCNREGCRYYDDNTFKVFYECKAQKALQLSANSITTKYCDLLQTLTEIKEIAEEAKKDICNNCGWRNTDSCDPTDYTCGEFIKILQKISECEGNDE